MWALFITISILASVAATLYHRQVLHHSHGHTSGYAIVTGYFSVILIAAFLAFKGVDTRFDLIPWQNVILMVALWAGGDILLNKAVRVTESSLFSILFSTRLLWSVLTALIFLNESLTAAAIAGTALILFSVLLVLWEKGLKWRTKPALFSLGTALLYGLALTNDGFILKDGFDVPTYYVLAFALPTTAILLTSREGRKSAADILKSQEKNKLWLLAFLHAASGIFLFYAFQADQQLAVLQSLNQTQIILVVLGAIIFLKERKDIQRRLLASLVTFIGVLLIVV